MGKRRAALRTGIVPGPLCVGAPMLERPVRSTDRYDHRFIHTTDGASDSTHGVSPSG